MKEINEEGVSKYLSEKGKYTFLLEVYEHSLEFYVGLNENAFSADTCIEEDFDY